MRASCAVLYSFVNFPRPAHGMGEHLDWARGHAIADLCNSLVYTGAVDTAVDEAGKHGALSLVWALQRYAAAPPPEDVAAATAAYRAARGDAAADQLVSRESPPSSGDEIDSLFWAITHPVWGVTDRMQSEPAYSPAEALQHAASDEWVGYRTDRAISNANTLVRRLR